MARRLNLHSHPLIHRRSGLDSEQQLTIYRHATHATLSQALRLRYPIVEKVCESAVFAAAIDQYVRTTRSRSGDLEQYGDTFGDFLDRFGLAAGLPHLPDLARLEWLIAQLRRAPLAKSLGREELAAIARDALPDLRLPLVPRAGCSGLPTVSFASGRPGIHLQATMTLRSTAARATGCC